MKETKYITTTYDKRKGAFSRICKKCEKTFKPDGKYAVYCIKCRKDLALAANKRATKTIQNKAKQQHGKI